MNFETKRCKEEALLNKFQNSENKKYVEMKVDEVSVEIFNEIFKSDNIDSGKSTNLYERIGRQEGLLKNLDVRFKVGLKINNKEEFESRAQKFGRNDPIIKEPKTLYELILECLEDPMLRILLGASVVSLMIGVAQQGWARGWIEGFSIFMAVFIVVSISSFNNLSKEQQFARLNKENEKKMVNVRRNSKKVELSVDELLVGDIIYLEIGNVVCSDCIILEGGVEVDQSSLTGESEKMRKNPVKSPFLISGSMITDGGCEAVVCAVGVNSTIGRSKLQMQKSDDKTPLTEKLTVLADQISFLGIALSILIFAVMVCKEIILRLFYTEETIFNSSMLDVFVNAFIIGITVAVVAIPEGLPMAVTIALAFSVLKLKQEDNLVRHLDASETMGNVNNICTDKTGTLTEGNMSVRSFFFQGKDTPTSDKNLLKADDSNYDLLIRSVANNVTAYIDKKDNAFQLKGNSTECAVLKYLLDNKVDLDKYHDDQAELKYRVPFKSENKYMGSIYLSKDNKSAKIYLKGAPEIIFEFCSKFVGKSNSSETFTREVLDEFLLKQNQYASKSERTLAYAYAELNPRQLDSFDKKDDIQAVFDFLLKQRILTLVGMMGIADPPRPDVKNSIAKCRSAGVTVRMITGDNINTALSISREVGILTEYECNLTLQRIESKENEDISKLANMKLYALEGKVFRQLSGGYIEVDDPDNKDKKKFVLKDVNKFTKTTENLKVIARASPDDKFLLVLGLKELRNIVAVTGDGTNDAPALKKSDVGFAMGKKGTDIAKEASDIILLNDSFSSVVTAIKYGRNVYDCIRKFIQFQLTTNLVAVFMTLLGGIVLKDAPLNAIQMLWVNLIMDSLASLALATEEPSEKLLSRAPYPREEHMITRSMIKNIIFQGIFQIILLSIFLFFGDQIFGVPDDRSLSHFEWNDVNGYHFTIFFNIFVFLQVFNSINARKLEQSEMNVFENIAGNNIYIGVQAFIVVGQILMVQYGGRPLRTHPLTLKQHFACIAIASSSLVAGYIGKNIETPMDKIPTEQEILTKLGSISGDLKDRLPSRGKSFRSESRSYMAVSHKK